MTYQVSLLLGSLVETAEGILEASSKLLQRVGRGLPGGHGCGGVEQGGRVSRKAGMGRRGALRRDG
ncbi:unnamed protein product [Fusarium graminearum]|nr:unnamed protein product [Fusarium graminearum]